MMKKFPVIMLAAMLAFGVGGMSACGGGGDDGGDTDTVKVVKVWLHKSEAEPEGKTFRAIQDMFNDLKLKTDDGRTIVMSIEYKNTADALSTAISGEILSGGLPDVVAVDSPNITAYASDEILVPIGDYLEESVA